MSPAPGAQGAVQAPGESGGYQSARDLPSTDLGRFRRFAGPPNLVREPSMGHCVLTSQPQTPQLRKANSYSAAASTLPASTVDDDPAVRQLDD